MRIPLIITRMSLFSVLAACAYGADGGGSPGDSPSGPCDNGGTTPPECGACNSCSGECTDPPGNSTINQFTGLYIHDAVVYQTGRVLDGGCVTCGGIPNEVPRNLPSLSLKRFYRSRNAGTSGSLGANHFLSSDVQVRLDWASADGTRVVLRLFEPAVAAERRYFLEQSATDTQNDGILHESNGLSNDARMCDAQGTLTANGLQAATVVITDREGTVSTYSVFDQGFGSGNRAARLVSITERTGVVREAITYVYPTSASDADLGGDRARLWEISKVTAADGTAATFAYDNSIARGGHYAVSHIVLPNRATTSFTYSGDDLTTVTLPDGSAATFALSYDPVLQKVKTIISDSAAEPDHQFKTVWWTGSSFILPATTVIAQTVGKIRRIGNGVGEPVLVVWSGPPTSPTADESPTYLWHADSGLVHYIVTQGAIEPTSRARGASFVLGQDPFGAVLSESELFAPDIVHEVIVGQTDSLGHRKSGTYDTTNRRVTSVIDYDGTTETTTYNKFSYPLVITDRVGRQTVSTYDAHGNRLSKTMGSGSEISTWRWEYDIRGLITAAIDANGNRSDYTYDAVGRLMELIEPADVVGGTRAHQFFTYDAAGQLVSHTDASGRTVTYAYDQRSRVIRTTYADASTELTTYGAGTLSGLVVVKTDRNQHLTMFEYDATGRRVHSEWASGTPEKLIEDCTYVPGSAKHKATCTRGGDSTQYTYDPRGRLIARTVSPVIGRELTTSFSYDEKSRAFSQSDPYGRFLYRAFDPVDRVTRTVQELVPGAVGTPAQVEALALATYVVPSFTSTDIGGPALAGSSVVAGTVPGAGSITIQGAGDALLWGSSDQLQFFSRPLEGDATLTVRLDSQTQPSPWSKTGLMLRTSLAADAPFVAVLVGWQGISIQYRPSVGAAIGWPEFLAVPAERAPVWLRAQSLAATVHLSMSDDGVVWTGLAALPFERIAGARIGLCVTSYTAPQYSTAVYSHMSLQLGALDPAPLSNLVNSYLASLPRDLSVNPGYVIEETEYDASGLVTARIDGRGIRSTTVYDSQLRVTLKVEAAGTPETAKTVYGYDAQGNRIHMTNPRGFMTAMSYTGRNMLANVTEAFGTADAATTTYVYSPTHKILTMTDALDRTIVNTYEVCCDRLATITDSAGFVTAYTYDSVGNCTSITDANGLTTLMTFDGRNRPVTITNGAGETTKFAYTENASVLPEAAGLGLGTGADGAAVSNTNALGERSLVIQDSLGRTVRQMDALGHATTVVYDALVVNNGVTLVATGTSDPRGHTITAHQDGAGRTRVRLDALHLRNTFGYDAAGNFVIWRDANGVGKEVTYDTRNRDVTAVDTAGAVMHKAYDANNNLMATTDALEQVETTVFDACDRKISTTDRIGATTTFIYDVVSNLTSITDAEGGVTLYRYDLRNLLNREVFPQGQSARAARYYAYDAGRRLISRTVAGIPLVGVPPDTAPLPNEVTIYAYDDANRLIERGYPDHLNDAFAYDMASRLTAATSTRYANQVARLYDAAGRLTKETLSFTSPSEAADLPVSYAYDADNQVTQLTYPDGSQVQRAYTPRHELRQVWDGGATVIARGYDAGGRLGITQYGNGLKEFRTYVPNDNLTASIATTGGVTNFTYIYDANKRKTEEHDWQIGGNSQRFSYDQQDRVIGWNRGNGVADPAGETDTWHLSPVGDWTTFSRLPHAAPAIVENRTHDPVHELLAINGLALAYDVKGNLTHDNQSQDFTWDFENRLLTADHLAQGQGDSATYSYDALGRRVKKTVTTAAQTIQTYFVNAGSQEVVEITGDITAFNDLTADPEELGAAPYSPVTGEGARGSLLAEPTAQRFNFQPADTVTPDGWVSDLGVVQSTAADRGWNNARTPVDRDHLGRPLYDTFTQLDTTIWKVPVANGTHAVVIMCGDANSRAQTNNLVINGIALMDATPYDGLVTLGYEIGSFDGYALTVTVTDGFVTIGAGVGALDPKINFIEIADVGTAIDAATISRVQAAAEQATHATTKPKAKVPPLVKLNIWGDYVDELVAYTLQKPRHAAGRFYAHANHLYSLSTITNVAGAVVERYKYDACGKRAILAPDGVITRSTSAYGSQVGFTGRHLDMETGLLYMRARYYSDHLGRFLTRDPLVYVNGFGLYSGYFVPNTSDPTGLIEYVPYERITSDPYWKFIGPRNSVERVDLGRKCDPCSCCSTKCWNETLVIHKRGDLWLQLQNFEYGITNITLQQYYNFVTGVPSYVAGLGVSATVTAANAVSQSSMAVAAAAESLGAGMTVGEGVMGGYVAANAAAASAATTAGMASAVAGAASVAGVGLTAFVGATYVIQELHGTETQLGSSSRITNREMRNETTVSTSTDRTNEHSEPCGGS